MNAFRRLVGWRPPLALSALAFCQTVKADTKVVDVKSQQQGVDERLTHKYLCQQACTVSVNASCQMLVVALVALSDASQTFKNELIKLMDVLENRKWTDDDTEDMLMEYRYNVSEAKTVYLKSVTAMDAALTLGQSSGEMCYAVEASTVFNIMSETFYSVEKEVRACIKDVREVEDKFLKVLADTIDKNPKNKQFYDEIVL